MAKILCLDDDRTSLAVLCATLRDCGHDPLPIMHSGQVVQQIRKHGAHAAVVDLLMPGCDGSDVIATIRRELGPGFPVIVSSHTSLQLRGSSDPRLFYAPKPVNRENLAAILRGLRLDADNATKPESPAAGAP